jgi:hypothetical protein
VLNYYFWMLDGWLAESDSKVPEGCWLDACNLMDGIVGSTMAEGC